MHLKEILEKYNRAAQQRLIVQQLQGQDNPVIRLEGLKGSSPAFIAASVMAEEHRNAVFIFPGKEEAAYFQNDFENILGDKSILFFPSSFKKEYKTEQTDSNSVLMRAEVLSRISKVKGQSFIVTYSEAIHELVTSRSNLAKNTIEARVGQQLSIEFINEFLIENGFDRTDFVFGPGEFSIRGGIVDVFSFANELPYRLEFNGNTMESVRCFDPVTQLTEKHMQFVTIIPDVQKQLARHETESFFDFLKHDTIIWAKELSVINEIILKQHELHQNLPVIHIDESEKKPEDIFDRHENIITRLKKHAIIEFGGKELLETDTRIKYQMHPQPSFNKNFDLLLANLSGNKKSGYDNFIFADGAKQVERLYSIFETLHSGNAMGKTEHENLFSSQLLSLHEGFIDDELKLACYTDHQVFNRYHRFRLRRNFSNAEAITLKELYSLKPGDFVTHIDHGVGRYGGLEKLTVNGRQQEAIRLIYKDQDILYISIHSLHRIARYTGKEGKEPVLNKLGSQAWSALKQKTKKRVKDIAKDLIALYAKRKTQKGFACSPDSYLQNELEASFIYEDTPDQLTATNDVKKDMQLQTPMDRLICGDVGFGKTEIAIRAAFKSVTDGKQVAILVPTTILAMQHHRTFSERLKDFPCTVDYINRFKTSAQQNNTIKKIKEGKIDIIIGTHRLLSKDIEFKDLGLLIVDEEQKFGVGAKEKIKALRTNVDTLTLTATPIPRTLQFSLMGARDLSIINTPPQNRFPVTTELHVFNDDIIREAINYEVSRGGQVFFIHNRVGDIHEMASVIQKLCPGVKIIVGHGQMDGEKLEEVMMSFIEGDSDVLVSTTIVESGLDISNANTIIINQAQNFGLSDLHQMRGRVGRSNKKAFCYLLTPPLTVLTSEARQRLKAVEEFSDLGSGFNIAMRDLDIRGAGNLLGGEQSGFISEIGFEMYHKILDEAIQELKETDFKELFSSSEATQYVSDCVIESDMEILIPTEYVESTSERLNLYRELDEIETEETLITFGKHLCDRFGPLPFEVEELMDTIRLRWKAKSIGFEKIVLKNNVLKAYFIGNAGSDYFKSKLFSSMLTFIQAHPQKCKMKEEKGKLSLTLLRIQSITEANKTLDTMLSEMKVKKEGDLKETLS